MTGRPPLPQLLLAGLLLSATFLLAGGRVTGLANAMNTGDPTSQIASGAVVYQSVCVSCHGVDREGGEGPALDGRTLGSFRTGGRLYNFVRLSMPYDAPGSLSEQEYFDVIAYLLAANGLNPDRIMVGPDTAEGISLQ